MYLGLTASRNWNSYSKLWYITFSRVDEYFVYHGFTRSIKCQIELGLIIFGAVLDLFDSSALIWRPSSRPQLCKPDLPIVGSVGAKILNNLPYIDLMLLWTLHQTDDFFKSMKSVSGFRFIQYRRWKKVSLVVITEENSLLQFKPIKFERKKKKGKSTYNFTFWSFLGRTSLWGPMNIDSIWKFHWIHCYKRVLQGHPPCYVEYNMILKI